MKTKCCDKPNLTWVGANGKVTHDAIGWPAKAGVYCYSCEAYTWNKT